MAADVKKNLQKSDSWVRVLYMLLFFVFSKIAIFILSIIILFQGVHFLFTTKKNFKISGFAGDLNLYIHEVFKYLLFDSNVKPFPFEDWVSASTPVVKKAIAKKPATKKAAKKKK